MLIETLQNSIENKWLRRSCFKSHPRSQGAAGAMWRPELSWLRSAGTTMQNPSKCSVWEAEGAVCHPRTGSRAHLSLQSTRECLPKVFSWQITEHFYTKTQIFQYKIYIFFPCFPHWYWWLSSRLSQARELWRWEWWPPSLWLLINSRRSLAAATWLKTHRPKAFINLLNFMLAVNIILQCLHSCCFLFKRNNEKAHLFS